MLKVFSTKQKNVSDRKRHLLFAIEPWSGDVKAYLRKSVLSLPFPRWYVAINAYGESYKRGFYRYSSAIQLFESLVNKYSLEISEKVNLSKTHKRIEQSHVLTVLA
jgi:hypothetical protein